MQEIMKRITDFIKKEIVGAVSFVLCICSMFFVAPGKGYLEYIDIRTLVLLFCLMCIMAGLRQLGVFDYIAGALLKRADKSYQLYIIPVLLCFFSSMVITNDVALITFVPFTIITLKMAGQKHRLIYIVSAQTVAANLGSMLTPLGNPQNLYLFSAYNMSGADFFKAIVPYSVLSLILLLIGSVFSGKEKLKATAEMQKNQFEKHKLVMYLILFVLALLTVFRLLPYYALLAICVAAVLIFDRKTLIKVDYSLLLTFVFLFIFIGNLGNISAVSQFLKKIVVGNEVIVGIASSQVFSNVPACLLLSGFTNDAANLLIGVNLGGLGTLIASMASLISYKFIAEEDVRPVKYIAVFTVINVVFLAANLVLWLVIR